MRRWGRAMAALTVVALAGLVRADETDPASPPPGWQLSWSDEFNGNQIDRDHWIFETGNGQNGWGNHEKEYYTDRPENAYVKDGALHIRAMPEENQGFKYTSAKMLTRGHFSQKYGRFDFRAKLPTGAGLWPALWMMPAKSVYGGWPRSGEIDVTEARGQKPDEVLGTIHFGAAPPHNTHSGAVYHFPDGTSIADWHLYSLEWEPGVIRWLVDGKLYSTKRWWYSAKRSADGQQEINPWPAPFDQPFYLILNVAVGGDFLKGPDASTQFPQEMVVDYVRVYEKVGGYGPVQPEGPQPKGLGD